MSTTTTADIERLALDLQNLWGTFEAGRFLCQVGVPLERALALLCSVAPMD